MAETSIEWTDATWNPVTGCDKISPGCKNCYAEKMALRLQKMEQANYVNGFNVTLQPHMLEHPLKWKKPRMIFVNSMSDLFHKDVPLGYIKRVFDVMNRAHWHTFQVLTKRADRLAEVAYELNWTPNIWQGASVEDQKYGMPRIDYLRTVPAAIRFLSVEPLLEDLGKVDLTGIQWVIVGGESGPGARPMNPQWARSLQWQCEQAGVPYFFKQNGEWVDFSQVPDELENKIKLHWFESGDVVGRVGKKAAGRILDGRTWDEMPNVQPATVPVTVAI